MFAKNLINPQSSRATHFLCTALKPQNQHKRPTTRSPVGGRSLRAKFASVSCPLDTRPRGCRVASRSLPGTPLSGFHDHNGHEGLPPFLPPHGPRWSCHSQRRLVSFRPLFHKYTKSFSRSCSLELASKHELARICSYRFNPPRVIVPHGLRMHDRVFIPPLNPDRGIGYHINDPMLTERSTFPRNYREYRKSTKRWRREYHEPLGLRARKGGIR